MTESKVKHYFLGILTQNITHCFIHVLTETVNLCCASLLFCQKLKGIVQISFYYILKDCFIVMCVVRVFEVGVFALTVLQRRTGRSL